MRRHLTATTGLAVLLAGLILAMSAGPSAAMPRLYECQHPMTTGEEAFHLRHVDPHTACRVVRKLAAWLSHDHNPARLYRCRRPDPNAGGTPVLKMHRFDGWRLRLSPTDGFVVYRGHRSFAVTGTDFPLACS